MFICPPNLTHSFHTICKIIRFRVLKKDFFHVLKGCSRVLGANKSTGVGPAVGGRKQLHGMGQKEFKMSKMSNSCHEIVMWANVCPFCLYTTVTSGIVNTAHIMNTIPTKSTMTME
jgi:hypothetical protein